MNYVFQFGAIWKDIDLLLLGAWLTVKLSFLTLAIGLVVGTVGALFRISRHRVLRAVARTYIEAIRNTPFLIQLLLLYLGLPAVGIRLAPEQAALVALVVNFGAYATEIIRAGIEAIPKGQIEAGRSLGLSSAQIFFLIVMKPALRIVYPALSSQFVLLVLTSSVVSARGTHRRGGPHRVAQFPPSGPFRHPRCIWFRSSSSRRRAAKFCSMAGAI